MSSKGRLLIMLSLCCAGFVFAGQFVNNGDFEQPLTTGWTQATSGSGFVINRATNYDPDPDYEAQVFKSTGTGYAKLYQSAAIPTTDLEFSANLKLIAATTSSTCWAGTALIIGYLNPSGSLLGETMICRRTAACPWQNTSTRHLIDAVDTLWHNYAFNINSELANLPGVNPASIAKIEIALYSQCYSG